MRTILIALGVASLLGACTENGDLSHAAQTVACLPKGVYLGEAFGARYTEAQKAAIDALRVINCANAAALGYGGAS